MTSGGTQVDLGPVTLAGTSTIDTAGGVLNALDADGTGVDGIATAGSALTLNGGATGVITVSTLSAWCADADGLGFDDVQRCGDGGRDDLTDTTGTVSFEGDTSLASLVTTTAATAFRSRVRRTRWVARRRCRTPCMVLGNEATDSIEFTVASMRAEQPGSTTR